MTEAFAAAQIVAENESHLHGGETNENDWVAVRGRAPEHQNRCAAETRGWSRWKTMAALDAAASIGISWGEDLSRQVATDETPAIKRHVAQAGTTGMH